jgi:carboxylate-amine ligase
MTEDSRYHQLTNRVRAAGVEAVSCACHVHVAVPTRDLGVAVLNRIRGWLPVLLALSVNSPLWRESDSGWAGYRYVVQGIWPTATVPPRTRDAMEYDAAVADRIAAGDALDSRSIYYFARLSPRYPTVEIRIADTAPTVDEAVLLAGLCRALVMTAMTEAASDRPYLDLPEALVQNSLDGAARLGLDALLVDPLTGRSSRGGVVLDRLIAQVTPALEAAGDRAVVSSLLADRLRRRSGAARQRALWRRLDREEFVTALSVETSPQRCSGAA